MRKISLEAPMLVDAVGDAIRDFCFRHSLRRELVIRFGTGEPSVDEHTIDTDDAIVTVIVTVTRKS